MTAREELDTILGYLGFPVEIQEEQREDHIRLQVLTHDAGLLIGRHTETLDALQYVVNRLTQSDNPDSPRAIVDVDHHREMHEDALLAAIDHMAEVVRSSGKSAQTDPLPSSDRYIVHNHLKDTDVETWSPDDRARLKRITLRLKRQ